MTQAPPAEVVAERLAAVRQRIVAAGGDPAAVQVLAVTKGFDASAVAAAQAVGLFDVGENYAQELLAKAPSFGADIRWHFIGRLQRNKVRMLAGSVACWQTIDRPELLDEVARRAPGAAVFIQVNVSGEPQKGGAAPADVAPLVERARALELNVRGLMTVGVAGDGPATRAGFRKVHAMSDELGLQERSMGMTGDLEMAVEEGSTMIRVGTALFGPRVINPVARD